MKKHTIPAALPFGQNTLLVKIIAHQNEIWRFPASDTVSQEQWYHCCCLELYKVLKHASVYRRTNIYNSCF
jgi:hypothetical protein